MLTDMSGIRAAIAAASSPKIVRVVGDLASVVVDGKRITRKQSIPMYLDGIEKPPLSVNCAPYDNHFVFKDMSRIGWTTFCTCGSAAVVVGYDAYKQDASAQGALLVCLVHTQSGKHADGSS